MAIGPLSKRATGPLDPPVILKQIRDKVAGLDFPREAWWLMWLCNAQHVENVPEEADLTDANSMPMWRPTAWCKRVLLRRSHVGDRGRSI